jgi:hypothetical protein
MKLHTPDSVIEIQGSTEESTDFRLELNAKAFRVLSSGLYKDKIGSIVREICSNAYDGHVAGGNPTQAFELHLPDAFEPWFSVKDFGIGLSKEEIKSIYTSYFTSTKDKTNDFIGSFGLGSKSPFSYTDQFTITSTKEGITSVHSAYLKPCGTPSIIEMHSQTSFEPSGVEIKMSVKAEDYRSFAEAAKNQLAFFETKPVFTNAPYNFAVLSPFEGKKIEFAGTNFKAIAEKRGIMIVQGNVAYPLDVQLLGQAATREALDFINNLANNFYVAVYFNIGEINVTASREGLEYTKETIENILATFAGIQQEVEASIKDRVKNAKSNWEMATMLTSFGAISRLVDSGVQWLSDSDKPQKLIRGWSFDAGYKLTKAYYYTWQKSTKKVNQSRVNAGELDKIYFVDKDCKYVKSRIKAAAYGKEIWICNEGDKEAVTKALGGFDNFVALSTIPFVPAKRLSGSSQPKAEFYHVDIETLNLSKSTDDLEDYLDGESFICLDQTRKVLDYQDILKLRQLEVLKSYGVEVPEVVAMIPKDAIKARSKQENHVNLADFIAEKTKEVQGLANIRNTRIALAGMLGNVSERFAADTFKGTGIHRLAKLKLKALTYTKYAPDAIADKTLKPYVTAKIETSYQKVLVDNPILKIQAYDLRQLTDEELKSYLK